MEEIRKNEAAETDRAFYDKHKHHRSVKVDMINGPLLGPIIKFALPVALGAILQQLFNAVDVAVVGRFASSEALAAVGSNTAVISLFVNLFVGISIGTSVMVARYVGMGEKRRIPAVVHTSLLFAAVAGVLLTGLIIALSGPILHLMGSPDDVIDLAILYLRIYALGVPFIMVYNFGAAILRSVGDSRRPLYCLVLSGVVNACLNLFFVIVCGMSVSGVALATVISNVLNAAVTVGFLIKEEDPIRLRLRSLAIDRRELVKILRIGVPAGLQSAVFSISNITIQSSVNSFGAAAIAGTAVAVNFDAFAYFLITGFVQAAVSFIGQNYGAGRADRCRKVFVICLLTALVSSFTLDMVFISGKMFFIGLFTKDAAVIPFAVERLVRVLTFQCLVSTYEVSSACLRGLGYSLTPAILIVFGTCILRIVWVAAVISAHHEYGLLVSIYPITWVVTGTMVVTAYLILSRKAYARLKSRVS